MTNGSRGALKQGIKSHLMWSAQTNKQANMVSPLENLSTQYESWRLEQEDGKCGVNKGTKLQFPRLVDAINDKQLSGSIETGN